MTDSEILAWLVANGEQLDAPGPFVYYDAMHQCWCYHEPQWKWKHLVRLPSDDNGNPMMPMKAQQPQAQMIRRVVKKYLAEQCVA